MPTRLLQVVTTCDDHPRLLELLDEAKPPCVWYTELEDEKRLTSVLLRAELVEPISDALQENFDSCDQFRIVLLPVEATHPQLPEPEKEDDPNLIEEKSWSPRFGRVSREELLEDIQDSAKTTPVFMIMVGIATIVSSVGLIKDSPAIIIGAMVIAPLLGPNMALALGTTLGDLTMIKRAFRANLVGLGIAIACSAVFGFFVQPDNMTDELTARTIVDLGDVLVALASGAAGAIAFTSGAPATIVGVMVAVALLPPTAASGMLAGAGGWLKAGEAATLVANNIVCINLSATTVFFVQGVRPSNSAWIEKDKAKKASIRAIALWTLALMVLATLIVFAWND